MKKNFWMCKANLGAEGRSCRFFHACISNLVVPLLLHCSVLVQHLIEGVIELPRDRVDLELLPDDLVLQLVDPEVELADVHLGVLGTRVRLNCFRKRDEVRLGS